MRVNLPVPVPGQTTTPTVDKHVTVLLDSKDGTPGRQAFSTTGGFAQEPTVLAPPRDGHDVEAFTTGSAYFQAIAKAISGAQQHVWIAGWQLGWDVELDEFGQGSTRLIDVISKLDRQKVDVRIMIFGTKFSTPPIDDVHVAETFKKLGCKVMRAKGESDFSETLFSYFSHHQKCVIIDGKVAFIGGLDLAHGRRDDHTFNVIADKASRRLNEMYNACVPHTRNIEPDEQAWVNLGTKPGGAREAYDNKEKKLLDHHNRPRQPWQDVHLKLQGPAVFDLVSNYVRRWNGLTIASRPNHDPYDLPQPERPQPIETVGQIPLDQFLPDKLEKAGNLTVQILRSASADQNERELRRRRTLPEAMLGAGLKQPQVDIQEAMIRSIRGAQQYIYIENQYFISNYGQEQVVDANGALITSPPASDELKRANELFKKSTGSIATPLFYASLTKEASQVSNLIVSALGARIRQAIMEDAPFHVYLMMPLHSEGLLNSPMMMGVMHQTMQTITFGSHSLINLIKRALLEKEYLLDGKSIDSLGSEGLSRELWRIPESAWSKYLTLLYGRNFGLIPQGPLVTEQIYVHSKCMIVDDNVVIVGSANINDRSLMGDRDSEIAAMIVDSQCTQATLCGNKPAMVRKFARDLRQSLWKKHLGLAGALPTGGPQAAADLASILEAPASPDTVAKIQTLAKNNSQAYEKAFPWVPRNADTRRVTYDGEDPVKMGSSIWAGWQSSANDQFQPWSEAFSYPVGDQAEATQTTLVGQIKGFWCSYPYLWTHGQNNYDPRIALELLSQKEAPRDTSAISSHV